MRVFECMLLILGLSGCYAITHPNATMGPATPSIYSPKVEHEAATIAIPEDVFEGSCASWKQELDIAKTNRHRLGINRQDDYASDDEWQSALSAYSHRDARVAWMVHSHHVAEGHRDE